MKAYLIHEPGEKPKTVHAGTIVQAVKKFTMGLPDGTLVEALGRDSVVRRYRKRSHRRIETLGRVTR